MRLEIFFEKFDQFADAPNAVAKMRELVLDLAVRGRLFGKAEHGKQVIRKGGTADNSAEDVADGLPSDWRWRPLGEVAQFINGDRSKNYPSKSFRVNDGVPFINAGHLANGDVSLTEMDYITPEHFDRLGGGKIERGDVLYCLRGSLGKCALVQSINRGAIASSLLIIRPSRQIISQFVYMCLVSPLGVRMISKYDNGSAQPNLSATNVKKYVVPLPPIAEQKRIVAKVDELMALCDRLESQQQERETRRNTLARASLARFADAPTPDNLQFLFHPSYTIPPEDLRKSILTLAVQGKLVPQDPNDEPADECLSRLGLKSTVASLTEADADNDLIPPAWVRVRFEDVALIAGGVTLGRKLGGRKTVTLPYLRVANVKRGEIDLTVIKEVSIAEDEIERYALQKGDLLMTEGGDWDKVGRAAIWRGEISVCLHQNHVFRARMRSAEIAPYWFERYINSPIGRSYFESASKQTTNLASINMRQVRSCPIPVPPLAEQRRIVAKVDYLIALIDQMEAQLTASRNAAGNLMEAIVAEVAA